MENNNWILSSEKLPEIGAKVEVSEDGQTVDDTMIYTDERVCMLAGLAGGNGYFKEGFAMSDGSNLICDTPKYWRHGE